MKDKTIKIVGIATIGTSALLGMVSTATAATAANNVSVAKPSPKPVPHSSQKHTVVGTTSLQSGQVSPNHVSSCDSQSANGISWTANCRVDYGYSRAYTECITTNSVITWNYGSWVGTGYWKFGGTCAGHGYLRDYGYQNG